MAALPPQRVEQKRLWEGHCPSRPPHLNGYKQSYRKKGGSYEASSAWNHVGSTRRHTWNVRRSNARSAAAQDYAPQTAPANRQVAFELRGQPLHWLSFSIAEYYLDDVDQENGARARALINGHMNGATWKFYNDGTLEFVGGAGMPSELKYLSGIYTYNPDNGLVSLAVGKANLEPGLNITGAGFTGWYNPAANNVMLVYAANYRLSGHWHTVMGTFGQDMTVTYIR